MKTFIDTHRDAHGVEPICKVLPIAPSIVYRHAARVADPERRSARAKRDEALSGQIRRAWDDNEPLGVGATACAKSGERCIATASRPRAAPSSG